MVTADGRRYLLANTIESRRIAPRRSTDSTSTSFDFPWEEERQDPALVFRIAAEAAGSAALGSDAYPRLTRAILEADRLAPAVDPGRSMR